MKHLTPEEMACFLDGNTGGLKKILHTRHIRDCPQCRDLRAACEADRLFLQEVRDGVKTFEAFEKKIPPSLIVPPNPVK